MITDKQRAIARMEQAVARQDSKLKNAPEPSGNELERVRIYCALSRPQLLEIIGLGDRDRRLFNVKDDVLTSNFPQYVERAHKVKQLYDVWVAEVERSIPEGDILHSRDVARLFDVSESYFYILMHRGIVTPSETSPRRHYFNSASIKRSFQRGRDYVLADPETRVKGCFSDSFMRWLERQQRRQQTVPAAVTEAIEDDQLG